MKKRTVISMCAALVLLLSLSFAGPLSQASPNGKAGRLPDFQSGQEINYPGGHGLGCLPGKPDPRLKLDTRRRGAGAPLTASKDLSGDLPPAGDQGTQSSCVGWSTGYYYKTWWEKQEHPGWDLNNTAYRFSPSFIYNQINGGVDTGAMISDAMFLLQNKGDVDYAEFPYDQSDWTAQPNATELEAAKQYRIPADWGYFFLNDPSVDPGPYNNNVTPLKSQLASGVPLVLAIPVFDDFPDYGTPTASYYDSIYDEFNLPIWDIPPNGGNFWGGHAVCIAGYNDNANPGGATPEQRGGFLMVNSWGPTWNTNGRVYLSYKFVRQWAWQSWAMEDQDSSPRITSLSPSSARSGDTVTVKGSNFGAKRRSAKVTFPNGGSATVSSWTNAQIKVKVPSGTGVGNVYVYDWSSEKSNGKSFEGIPTATTWLLAEGATWEGFSEYVLVQNPNSSTADVTVTFMTPTGEVAGPNLSVPGQSRVTINVNDFLPNQDVSTEVSVTNGIPVCAERAMYVNAAGGKWGSHDSIGSPGVSNTWYLAEGATWEGFDEWVLVMNPYTESVDVQVTFQTPGGEVTGPAMSLAARTRGTVHVNSYVPNSDVSTKVQCTTPGKGVVAERSMYINGQGMLGCHNSMGSYEAAGGWGLAEGATWPGFSEWVVVQNPTGVPAVVDFFFLTPEGIYDGPILPVGPGARVSVNVNAYMPDFDVSTMVFTEADNQKVVVERAMYMDPAYGRAGAHNAPGSAYGSTGWYLPEGCTSEGFDEWVMVMNPDPENQVDVQLTFMTPGGAVPGPGATLDPATRRTFHVNEYVTGDVSTTVTSDGYVVAERAMYMDPAYGRFGAHDSLGVIAGFLGGGAACSSAARPLETGLIEKLKPRYLKK